MDDFPCTQQIGTQQICDSSREEANVTLQKTLYLFINGEKKLLKLGENTIGRFSGCDICLTQDTISSTHALIECDAADCSIKDLNSTNHTKKNGKVLKPHVVYDLEPESTLTFGDVVATFHAIDDHEAIPHIDDQVVSLLDDSNDSHEESIPSSIHPRATSNSTNANWDQIKLSPLDFTEIEDENDGEGKDATNSEQNKKRNATALTTKPETDNESSFAEEYNLMKGNKPILSDHKSSINEKQPNVKNNTETHENLTSLYNLETQITDKPCVYNTETQQNLNPLSLYNGDTQINPDQASLYNADTQCGLISNGPKTKFNGNETDEDENNITNRNGFENNSESFIGNVCKKRVFVIHSSSSENEDEDKQKEKKNKDFNKNNKKSISDTESSCNSEVDQIKKTNLKLKNSSKNSKRNKNGDGKNPLGKNKENSSDSEDEKTVEKNEKDKNGFKKDQRRKGNEKGFNGIEEPSPKIKRNRHLDCDKDMLQETNDVNGIEPCKRTKVDKNYSGKESETYEVNQKKDSDNDKEVISRNRKNISSSESENEIRPKRNEKSKRKGKTKKNEKIKNKGTKENGLGGGHVEQKDTNTIPPVKINLLSTSTQHMALNTTYDVDIPTIQPINDETLEDIDRSNQHAAAAECGSDAEGQFVFKDTQLKSDSEFFVDDIDEDTNDGPFESQSLLQSEERGSSATCQDSTNYNVSEMEIESFVAETNTSVNSVSNTKKKSNSFLGMSSENDSLIKPDFIESNSNKNSVQNEDESTTSDIEMFVQIKEKKHDEVSKLDEEKDSKTEETATKRKETEKDVGNLKTKINSKEQKIDENIYKDNKSDDTSSDIENFVVQKEVNNEEEKTKLKREEKKSKENKRDYLRKDKAKKNIKKSEEESKQFNKDVENQSDDTSSDIENFVVQKQINKESKEKSKPIEKETKVLKEHQSDHTCSDVENFNSQKEINKRGKTVKNKRRIAEINSDTTDSEFEYSKKGRSKKIIRVKRKTFGTIAKNDESDNSNDSKEQSPTRNEEKSIKNDIFEAVTQKISIGPSETDDSFVTPEQQRNVSEKEDIFEAPTQKITIGPSETDDSFVAPTQPENAAGNEDIFEAPTQKITIDPSETDDSFIAPTQPIKTGENEDIFEAPTQKFSVRPSETDDSFVATTHNIETDENDYILGAPTQKINIDPSETDDSFVAPTQKGQSSNDNIFQVATQKVNVEMSETDNSFAVPILKVQVENDIFEAQTQRMGVELSETDESFVAPTKNSTHRNDDIFEVATQKISVEPSETDDSFVIPTQKIKVVEDIFEAATQRVTNKSNETIDTNKNEHISDTDDIFVPVSSRNATKNEKRPKKLKVINVQRKNKEIKRFGQTKESDKNEIEDEVESKSNSYEMCPKRKKRQIKNQPEDEPEPSKKRIAGNGRKGDSNDEEQTDCSKRKQNRKIESCNENIHDMDSYNLNNPDVNSSNEIKKRESRSNAKLLDHIDTNLHIIRKSRRKNVTSEKDKINVDNVIKSSRIRKKNPKYESMHVEQKQQSVQSKYQQFKKEEVNDIEEDEDNFSIPKITRSKKKYEEKTKSKHVFDQETADCSQQSIDSDCNNKASNGKQPNNGTKRGVRNKKNIPLSKVEITSKRNARSITNNSKYSDDDDDAISEIEPHSSPKTQNISNSLEDIDMNVKVVSKNIFPENSARGRRNFAITVKSALRNHHDKLKKSISPVQSHKEIESADNEQITNTKRTRRKNSKLNEIDEKTMSDNIEVEKTSNVNSNLENSDKKTASSLKQNVSNNRNKSLKDCLSSDSSLESNSSRRSGKRDLSTVSKSPIKPTQINELSMKIPSTPKRRKMKDLSESVARSSPRSRQRALSSSSESTFSDTSSERRQKLDLSSVKNSLNVCFTMIENPTKFASMLKLLNSNLTDNVLESDILVTKRVARSIKFLCFLALGKPIVSLKWLTDSERCMKFRDHDEYILEDKEAETKFHFNLKKSIHSAKVKKLLDNYSVFVTKSVLPKPDDVKSIVECSGGKFLSKEPSKWSPYSIIITSPSDAAQLKKLLSISGSKPSVVISEFLLSGVLQQTLNFEKFKFK